MDRRTFLRTVGLSAAALGSAGFMFESAGFTREKPRAGNLKNWVWITVNPDRSVDNWKRSFALMRRAGIRAILPEIYDGRHAYFASTRLPVKIDLLGKITPLARAEDLEVHAWMWSMPCMLDDILKKHPDWYNVNAKGESAATNPAYVDYYKFLDPGRPEVREFVQGAVAGKMPGAVGNYTKDLVYSRLAPGVLHELERLNPPTDAGYRKHRHHQFLTRDVGHPALSRRLYELIGMARASETWEKFYRVVDRTFPKLNATLPLPLEYQD